MKAADVQAYFNQHERCSPEVVERIMEEATARARENGSLWLVTNSGDSQVFGGYCVGFSTFQVLSAWLVDEGVLPAQFNRHTYERGKLFILNASEDRLCLAGLAQVMFMGDVRARLIAEKLARLGYIEIQADGSFNRLKKHTQEQIVELARKLSWKYNRCDTELLERLLYLGHLKAQITMLSVNYVPRRLRKDLSVPREQYEAMVRAGDYSLVKDPIGQKIFKATHTRPKIPLSGSIQFHPL